MRRACLKALSAWDEGSEAGHQNVTHHGFEDHGHPALDHGPARHQSAPSCFQAPAPNSGVPCRIPALANHASAITSTLQVSNGYRRTGIMSEHAQHHA